MRILLAATTAAAMFFLGAGAAFAQPAPGTALTGTISTGLDSKTAYVGEDVVANNVSSSDGSIRGATLQGAVTRVVRAGQGRNAQLGVHFNYLRLSNGRVYPVNGVVQSMQVNTKSNAAKEAGGALVGMLAGNAIAKTVLGAKGGGIVGAVGGYLIARNNRADVTIPANSTVSVTLVSPRRQAY
jgi:hypothetical protein